MKYGVDKQVLLITAGMVWTITGVNILIVGISCWNHDTLWWPLKAVAVAAVFFTFYFGVFRKLYRKHTHRIEQKGVQKHCPFSFFDARGWFIAAGMTGMGIGIRTFGLLPDLVISLFYTGLSGALILTGALFIRRSFSKRCKKPL